MTTKLSDVKETHVENPPEVSYPPDTAKNMSWSTLKFLNSPTSRVLNLTAYFLIATFIVCLFLGRLLHLDVSVTGVAEVTVNGGVRDVVSPIDGVVTKVFKKNGESVKEMELIARIQMDDEASNEIEKVAVNIEKLTAEVEATKSPIDLKVSTFSVSTLKIYDPTVLQALANVEHAIHDFTLQKAQVLILNSGKANVSLNKTSSEIYYANKRIDFLTKRIKMMQASSHRQLLESYIDSTEEELGRLKTQVTSAKQRVNSALDQGFADLLRNLRIATGVLDDYRHHHEVRAPIAGVIGKIIEGDNIHLVVNKSVATIIPDKSQFITRIKMKSQDIVRLKKGQKVFYKVEAYPFQRFGLFTGEIVDFDQVKDVSTNLPGASDDTFDLYATIYPPEHLTPSLKERIKFIYGMRAEAKVVLDRKSIDEIIIDKFFKLKDL